MLAVILFDFAGKQARREHSIFTLSEELGDLTKGDIVVVEGFSPGEQMLGIFMRAFPNYIKSRKVKQIYLPRKQVLKKACKSGLLNLVTRRYDIVKDLEISNTVYEKYKNDYRYNQDKTLEEVRRYLMRNIIIAAEDHIRRTEEMRVFIFGNMEIVLKDNVVIDLIPLNRQQTVWVKPTELDQIALEYINEMESSHSSREFNMINT